MRPTTVPASASALRLSAVVRDLLNDLSYLQECLRLDLVNYSALARMLKPSVDAKMGEPVSPEAITMALRRHSVAKQPLVVGEVYHVISQCKASVQGDMVSIHYPYTEALAQKINHLKNEIHFEGEKMYVIQRSDEISIFTHSRFLPFIQKIAGKTKPLESNEHLSLLTITYFEKGHHTPGIVNFFIRLFNESRINLWGVFSSFSKVSFVLDEANASVMFDRLTRAIQTAKDLEKTL